MSHQGAENLRQSASERMRTILANPQLFELGKRGFHAQYEATHNALRQGVADAVYRLMSQTMERVQSTLDVWPSRPQWACRAGCSLCCRMRVDVHPAQAIAIAEHLRRQCGPEQLAEIHAKLRSQAEKIEQMTPDQHAVSRLGCVFLSDGGLCGIYAIRPLKCALCVSFSLERCQAALCAAGSSATFPTDLGVVAWGDGVGGGLMRACADLALDYQTRELHSGVLRALSEADLAARWLHGEKVFRGCVSTSPE